MIRRVQSESDFDELLWTRQSMGNNYPVLSAMMTRTMRISEPCYSVYIIQIGTYLILQSKVIIDALLVILICSISTFFTYIFNDIRQHASIV